MPKDANFIPVMQGVSSVDLETPTPIAVNPATGAVLTELTTVDYSTTSSTSLLIGTGSKTFTVADADRPYLIGTRLRAASNADGTNFMEGLVTSYSDTELIIDVDLVGGSGTLSDWNINLTGERGSAGATGSTGPQGPAGAGRRSATLVVAASDSLDTDVASSDYQCDGTADDVQIQAAIDALPATGGKVILMEGNFSINASIVISKNGVTLEGQGKGTIVKLANSKNVSIINMGHASTQFYRTTIRNIFFDGNKTNQTTGADIIDNGNFFNVGINEILVEGCHFLDAYDTAITDYGLNGTLINCSFIACDGNNSFYSVEGQGPNGGGRIINCYFETSTSGGELINQIDTWSIVDGCYFNIKNNYNAPVIFGCAVVSNCDFNILGNVGSIFSAIVTGFSGSPVPRIVSNNTIFSLGTANVASNGIYLQSTGSIVTGNTIDGLGIGIYLGASGIVDGNYIRNSKNDGIQIITGGFSTVSNNKILSPGQQTNNTYSGIYIESAITYNTIIGNVITSIAANKHKYGIRENASTSGPNIIANNICLNAVTAQISTQHVSTDVSHNLTA